MDFTKQEIEILKSIIDTEIMETKDLINDEKDGNTKAELEEYLKKIEKISIKLEE